MALAAYLAMALALSACDDPERCWLDPVVAEHTGGADYRDCGFLPSAGFFPTPAGVEATWRDARDCVQTSADSFAPFTVRWEVQGIDSYIARAYTGVVIDGLWTLSAFDHGRDLSHTSTRRSECDMLTPLATCSDLDLFSNLCLRCERKRTVEDCIDR